MPKNWIARALLLGLVAGATAAVIALLQRERITTVRFVAEALEELPYSSFREVLRIGIKGPQDMALSPNGRLLAIASDTGLWLYDLDNPGHLRLASGYELANRPWYRYGPSDEISSVAFSPDGQYLAFTTARAEPGDEMIHIQDVANGTVRRIAAPTPDRFCTWVPQLAYSADGTRLLVFGADRYICLWSAETGERELVLMLDIGDQVRHAALSPDGRYLVSVSDTEQVELWDARDGAKLGRTAGHYAAFGPDNLLLIANHDEKQVWVLDTPSLSQRLALEGEIAAFSPDGARIATAGDGEIALWSADGTELQRISLADPTREDFAPTIEQVTFSPDGTYLLAGGTWRSLLLTYAWDTATGERIWSDETPADAFFDPKRFDSHLLVQNTRAVRLGPVQPIVWDFGQESASIVEMPCFSNSSILPNTVRAAVFSPDAAQIIVVCRRADLLLLEADGSAYRSLPTNIPSDSTFIQDVAVTPDSIYYLTLDFARRETTATLWTLSDAESKAVVLIERVDVEADVDISPDGPLLAFGSPDGRLELYTLPDGQRRLSLGSPDADPQSVYRVRFSPDGTQFVALSLDNQARVWSVDDGAVVATLPHPQRVLAAAFSPDGTRIATGDEVGVVRLWSAADGQRQASYRLTADPRDFQIYDLAFSPDGQHLAAAWQENQVWVLDVNTGELAGTVGRHRGAIYSVAFSPDGLRILTVSGDGTARVWARPDSAAARAD